MLLSLKRWQQIQITGRQKTQKIQEDKTLVFQKNMYKMQSY